MRETKYRYCNSEYILGCKYKDQKQKEHILKLRMKESKLEIVRNKKHLILAPLQALGIEYTSGTTLTSFHNKL